MGYNLIEIPSNTISTLCSGTCGGLKQTNPDLANKIAIKLLNHIKKLGIKKIITSDPQSYLHLKENSQDFEVLEFSDILCDGLGIKRNKSEPLIQKPEEDLEEIDIQEEDNEN